MAKWKAWAVFHGIRVADGFTKKADAEKWLKDLLKDGHDCVRDDGAEMHYPGDQVIKTGLLKKD